ncbi:extracellular solute-binding protein [Spirochaeta dissipatitropha]
MKRIAAAGIILLILLAAGCQQDGADDGISISLWTQEGEADGAFQYVVSLAESYMLANPDIKVEVVNKETEALREDFITSSLAGGAPELLWTVNDHAGPFVVADLIQPVDGFYNPNDYIDGVEMGGNIWGVPINAGNHLMLMYNKRLVPEAPQNTDDMIAAAKNATANNPDVYGLVYNFTEPFWLVPWLGGFGGSVFEEDGVTPNLNSQEMIDTLQFMYDLKFTHRITPQEADYNTMDTLFKEGKAAMIINGDWTLGEYPEILGDDFAVAPIPMISSTGLWPAPYTSGKYFMVPSQVSGEVLDAVKDFITFAINEQNQRELVTRLNRLPGLLSLADDPLLTSDPIQQGSIAQMQVGTPMPSTVEMRANWDAMQPEQNSVLTGNMSPAEAAARMQTAAEQGIRQMQ